MWSQAAAHEPHSTGSRLIEQCVRSHVPTEETSDEKRIECLIMQNRCCPFCQSPETSEHIVATERMFGLGGQFRYAKCAKCGSLRLTDRPLQLHKYYERSYYSYASPPARGIVPAAARRVWGAALFGDSHLLRLVVTRIRCPSPFLGSLMAMRVRLRDRVLDIGCGRGALLNDFFELGFRNLYGIDPYLPEEELHRTSRYRIFTDFHNFDERFDLAMFNHSLEHVENVAEILTYAVSTLRSTSSLLSVRIPLADSFAQRYYGEHWVQLDAPRHVNIPSKRGLMKLCSKLGLELSLIQYDSSEFQFWGSEQYRLGINLNEPRSYAVSGIDSNIFDAEQIKGFKERARCLNLANDGDEAIFVFRRNVTQ